MSVSDILRHAVDQMLDDIQHQSNGHPTPHGESLTVLDGELERVHHQLTEKDEQLREKDQQISQLHQLLAMKEKNLATFGEQLDRTTLQLEDLRHQKGWFKRLIGAKS